MPRHRIECLKLAANKKQKNYLKKGIVVKFMIFFLNANILTIVTSGKNGFYRLGTSEGILKEVYEKSQCILCPKNLLRIKDIPDDEILYLSVAIAHSNGSGEGFVECMSLKQSNKIRMVFA
ncbi:UNVERIFIED_CONTAM: hypothetical protein NCL1_15055 [Trichonephila clavipes]